MPRSLRSKRSFFLNKGLFSRLFFGNSRRADRISVAIGLHGRPVFRSHVTAEHNAAVFDDEASEGKAAGEWTKIIFPGHSHGWEDLAFLHEHWDGPTVLTGIQTVSDARRAVEAGMAGIAVR